MDSLPFLTFYTILAFFLGSLPFSIWIGRVTTEKDIRKYGDHNPGATNVLRAGSRGGFLLAMILDICKGAVPVGLAYQQWGIQDWRIVPITLAPVAGHAFSPFLGGKGGKGGGPTGMFDRFDKDGVLDFVVGERTQVGSQHRRPGQRAVEQLVETDLAEPARLGVVLVQRGEEVEGRIVDFGCMSSSSLGAMVADPNDLVEGREMDEFKRPYAQTATAAERLGLV